MISQTPEHQLELFENTLRVSAPLRGPIIPAITQWFLQRDVAGLITETSSQPPLKLTFLLLRRELGWCELLAVPYVSKPDPSAPNGMEWAQDGRHLFLACLPLELGEIVKDLLFRLDRMDLLYCRPESANPETIFELVHEGPKAVTFASRGARYLKELSLQAASGESGR